MSDSERKKITEKFVADTHDTIYFMERCILPCVNGAK